MLEVGTDEQSTFIFSNCFINLSNLFICLFLIVVYYSDFHSTKPLVLQRKTVILRRGQKTRTIQCNLSVKICLEAEYHISWFFFYYFFWSILDGQIAMDYFSFLQCIIIISNTIINIYSTKSCCFSMLSAYLAGQLSNVNWILKMTRTTIEQIKITRFW